MSVTNDDALEAERLAEATPSRTAGRQLNSVEEILTPQQRAALHADLSEIARLRREAEETASLLRLR